VLAPMPLLFINARPEPCTSVRIYFRFALVLALVPGHNAATFSVNSELTAKASRTLLRRTYSYSSSNGAQLMLSQYL
jgi:hypothetical protein